MRKWEISLLIGVAVTLLWCAAAPRFELCWWTTAFEPLCDGILSADAAGRADIVLHSKLWELLAQYL